MAFLRVREVGASWRLFYCKNIKMIGTRAPGLFRKVDRLSEVAVITGLTVSTNTMQNDNYCYSYTKKILL